MLLSSRFENPRPYVGGGGGGGTGDVVGTLQQIRVIVRRGECGDLDL